MRLSRGAPEALPRLRRGSCGAALAGLGRGSTEALPSAPRVQFAHYSSLDTRKAAALRSRVAPPPFSLGCGRAGEPAVRNGLLRLPASRRVTPLFRAVAASRRAAAGGAAEAEEEPAEEKTEFDVKLEA